MKDWTLDRTGGYINRHKLIIAAELIEKLEFADKGLAMERIADALEKSHGEHTTKDKSHE